MSVYFNTAPPFARPSYEQKKRSTTSSSRSVAASDDFAFAFAFASALSPPSPSSFGFAFASFSAKTRLPPTPRVPIPMAPSTPGPSSGSAPGASKSGATCTPFFCKNARVNPSHLVMRYSRPYRRTAPPTTKLSRDTPWFELTLCLRKSTP